METQHPTLKDFFAKHSKKVSDKWAMYIAEYDRIFQPLKEFPIRLLEIGIQNGGSLEIWSKFFPNAEKIVGCDINLLCAQLEFDDPRITVVAKNANTDEAEESIIACSNNFDFIIDDGSHRSEDIIHSFSRYFPYLKDGGIYIAEDLHCSYWQDFNGGIFHPHSSISFFKRLADTINHEHWGIDKTRSEILENFKIQYSISIEESVLSHIHSIEFLNSMCIIKKASPANNVLGNRVVSGTEARVDGAPIALHDSKNKLPLQEKNPWSNRNFPIEDELGIFIKQNADFKQKLIEYEQEIAELQRKIGEQKKKFFLRTIRLKKEHEEILFSHLKQEKHFSLRLQELHSIHEQQIREQRLEYTAREQYQLKQLHQSQEEAKNHLQALVDQEAASAQHLLSLHQLHKQEINAQRIEKIKCETAYLNQQASALKQIEKLNIQLSDREKNFSQQLHELHLSHLQKLSEHAALEKIVKEKDSHIESILNREKSFLTYFKTKHEIYKTKIQEARKEIGKQNKIIEHTKKHLNCSNEFNKEIYSVFKEIPVSSILFWWKPIRKLSFILEKNLQNKEFAKNISPSQSINENYPMNYNFNRQTAPAASLDDLLALDDESFVKCAYATFLQREPDTLGFSYYIKRIRNGISKLEIIQQIRYGKEGKEKNIEIHGLNQALNRQKFSKIPLIGKAFSSSTKNSTKIFNTKNSNVACIIPYYNGSEFIERALISVFQQTLPCDEVIIVDDGSRTEELSFLKELNKKYNFLLISKRNGGQGSARNAGVAASNSKYICFLDQDDFYLPQHNEFLVKGIPSDDPDFGWVYGDLREADGDGLIVRMSMVKEHSVHPKHSLIDLIRNDMFVLPSASLINKKAYQDVGGFDEQFTGYEDDDLFLRLFRKGWSNTFVDKSVTTWCIHGESTSYSVKMSRSRFRYLNKLIQEYPDDPQKARYFFRDLIYPRFESLIVSDAIRAHFSQSKDREELAGYLLRFYEICMESPGFPEEILETLKHHVDNICH